MNSAFNEILETLYKRLDRENNLSGSQKYFIRPNVLEYWNSISYTQRENILMIKQKDVIESILQALKEQPVSASCDRETLSQEVSKRTFIFNRIRQSSLKVSITEFNHLLRPEESAENQNFYRSVVALEVEPLSADNKDSSAFPIVDEEKLSEYVLNIELLDSYRSLIKIKHGKIDTIFKTFLSLYYDFCQGNKAIIPEDQYSNVFSLNSIHEMLGEVYNNDTPTKVKGKNGASTLSPCRKLFNLLLLIFENNLIASYSKHSRLNGNYKNSYLPLSQQMYYHYPRNYQDMFLKGYGLYLENGPLATPYGMPYYNKKQIPKHWEGIHIGNLAFKLVDYGLEEEDYNAEKRPQQPNLHRVDLRSNNRRNERGSYIVYKPKYQTQENSNPPKQELNVSSKEQSLQSPLQVSLKQQSLPVPLLETIIKLPKANSISTAISQHEVYSASLINSDIKDSGNTPLSRDAQAANDAGRQTAGSNRKRLRLKQDSSNDFYQNNSHSQEWKQLVASTSATALRSNQILNVLQKTQDAKEI